MTAPAGLIREKAEEEVSPLVGDYPDIGDYAIVGDCRTAALVSRQGAVEWLCLPAFSSPSLFAAILDRQRGGLLAIQPRGVTRIERAYLPRTTVLQTRYRCTDAQGTDGVLEITDCMPLADVPHRQLLLEPSRELLRRLEVIEGRVTVDILYQPRPAYGRRPPRLRDRRKLGWGFQRDGILYTLLSDLPLTPEHTGRSLRGTATLAAGDKRYLSLTCAARDVGVIASLGTDADRRITRTVRWWHDWCHRAQYDGPHKAMVERSLLTLKLMSYAPSGALVAAPTMALPESLGGERNWDYRYCWPRDATLTLRALLEVGYPGEARAFLGWLLHTTRLSRPALLPLYDIYGRPAPREVFLTHLKGYKGSAPVRLGNGANHQRQLDIYGSVLLAASDFMTGGGELTDEEWTLLRAFGNRIVDTWEQPDSGIWEIRGDQSHHTYSKLMCWVGLDRLVALHDTFGQRLDRRRFTDARDRIRQAIDTRAWNDAVESYVGTFDGDQADASLLLMARLGYLDPNAPRMTSTLRFIEDQLTVGAFIRRYRHGEDPHVSREGAFGICSFWHIDLLALRGEVQRAEALFRTLISAANDVGLLAEEIQPDSGMLLGNFPQAFTHIGLVMAALAIDRARHDRDVGAVGKAEAP